MGNIYITSDLHLGHERDFIYGPRGFSDVKTHDATIIKNINNIVNPDDTLYILGDLMLNDNERGIYWINQIACRDIKVAIGNHDTDPRIELYKNCKNITDVQFAYRFKYRDLHFYTTHYPTLTANYDDKALKTKLICLCGHTHTKDKWVDIDKGLIYHTELDAHDNKPILLDDVVYDIKTKIVTERRKDKEV